MVRWNRGWLFGGLVLLFLAGCSSQMGSSVERDAAQGDGDKLMLVTTYSILYDLVKNVAGERAEVYSMVPIGANPHEYEPLPVDVQKVHDADAVFYNGLNLEQGGNWFEKLMQTAGKAGEDAPVFELSQGVGPIYLESKGLENEPDPHAWMDVSQTMIYVQNIRDALIQIDPAGQSFYEERAERYLRQLEALHEETKARAALVPQEKRFLVTSEGAFKYFGRAYGFQTAYIWEINSENQGTPEQIRQVVDLIRQKKITALFVETSVDPRSMETVSAETGVSIKGTVYTDSLGAAGSGAETYLEMMKTNIDTILQGVSE